MEKVIFEYDKITGNIRDRNGLTSITLVGMESFEGQSISEITLELVKKGVSTDDIIKLKNNDLL